MKTEIDTKQQFKEMVEKQFKEMIDKHKEKDFILFLIEKPSKYNQERFEALQGIIKEFYPKYNDMLNKILILL